MSDVPPPRAGRIAARSVVSVRIAALLLAACPAAVAAQQLQMVQTLNPDADRLAETMRRLGASPRDLSALIEAGDLSFRLGDATAAAAFYKRAEAIDPNNGRVKAGIGRILVNGERPGEALRYFELAQRYGAPMADYAGDRGLAYDLVGEQERAQRDYRAALARGGADADLDEVRRRYALSLGISGRQEEALAQIDTLLRRSDRGAWRARAFVLAMNGDVAGANRIASGMMPAGMAQGLAAFFRRLPTLSATDRAFAVHFGEVAATPARLADARLTPTLPPLGIDPTAPRQQVAAVPAPVARPLSRAEQRQQQRAAQMAARQSPRGTAAPASAPPVAYAARPAETGSLTAAAPVSAQRTPAPTTTSTLPAPATQVASNAGAQRAPTAIPPAGSTIAATRVAAGTTGYAATPPASTVPATSAVQTATATPPAAAVPTSTASVTPGTAMPSPAIAPRPEQAANAAMAAATATPGFSTPVASAPTPTPAPAQVASAVPTRPTAIGRGEDSILARIVAGITIPASELDVPPMPGAVPVVAPPPAPGSAASLEEAARVTERNAAADEEKRERLLAKRQADRAAAAAKAAADKKAKELAAKKEAAEKLAAEKKAARAEPERIWVQVAGGANEGDLPKAWKAVQAKAPVLAGRRAYATPLRATNRVVTGPFKTEAEARAFVNTLARQGVSAFSFTSAPGQKMTRLDAK